MGTTLDVHNEVTSLLSELHFFDKTTIRGDMHIIEDLNLDSIEIAELMIECEKRFNIVIPEDKEASLRTVNEITAYIEDHIKKSPIPNPHTA